MVSLREELKPQSALSVGSYIHSHAVGLAQATVRAVCEAL